MRTIFRSLAWLVLLLPQVALAQAESESIDLHPRSATESATSSLSTTLGLVQLSSLGLGAQLMYRPRGNRFALRGGWQFFQLGFAMKPDDNPDVDGEELTYDSQLTLNNGHLVGDWYPRRGKFRISAGLVINISGMDLVTNCDSNSSDAPLPVPGSCEFGNGSFSPDELGFLATRIRFNPVAPFVGVGWDNAPQAQRWFWMAELGVAYLGRADAEIRSSGNCSESQSCREGLGREEEELEEDLRFLRLYPLATVALGFRF